MGSDISFDIWIVTISMVTVFCSYLVICRTDKSWINWATPGYVITFGAIFLFPLLSLLSSGPVGSRYAYIFSYSTYALMNICLALAYAVTRRIPVTSHDDAFATPRIDILPWVLLAVGVLFYSPILIRFSPQLLHPREIYEQTRSGYGPLVFGSRAFLDLAFVVYLFKRNKSFAGALVFFSLCVAVVFFHGSKGLLVNLFSMAMLFWIYVKNIRVGFIRAASVMLAFTLFTMGTFAVTANLSDVSEILTYVQGYADYTKNAMIVIDDPAREPAWGRLTLGGEFYARVPRFLYPAKPSNFGMFKLAQDYFPDAYRGDNGDPDFSIGMQYADFGPLAIVYLCITSTLIGIMTGFAVRSLVQRASVPRFIILLFFAGIPVISFGAGYALPESLLIASGMWLLTRPKRSLRVTTHGNSALASQTGG